MNTKNDFYMKKQILILGFFLMLTFQSTAQYIVSPSDTIDVLFGKQRKELSTSAITTLKGGYVKP